MFRRSKKQLLAVPLVLALGAITAGCTTFSDSDNVARVGDVELTNADFEAQLSELGAASDEPIGAEPVRGVITTWIQEQLGNLPIDDEALRAAYEAGPETSGTLCLAGLVVLDESEANSIIDDIENGGSFADAFEESNIDDEIAATGGALPCMPNDEEQNAGVPFLQAAVELTPDNDITVAPLLDQAGQNAAWAVIMFRPYDELSDEDLAVLNAAQATDVDIHVDPRYGTYDAELARVVALG